MWRWKDCVFKERSQLRFTHVLLHCNFEELSLLTIHKVSSSKTQCSKLMHKQNVATYLNPQETVLFRIGQFDSLKKGIFVLLNFRNWSSNNTAFSTHHSQLSSSSIWLNFLTMMIFVVLNYSTINYSWK